MSDLIKTDIPNLYYRLNSKSKKVYVGVAYSGKRRHTKTFTTSIDVSLAELLKFKDEIKLLKNRIKFSDVFRKYITLVAPMQTKKEILNKESRYKNYFDGIKSKYISEIQYSDLQTIINNMIDVKELSPKTAKNTKQLLQVIFDFAQKEKYINYNIAKDIKIPKFDNKQELKVNLTQATELIHNTYYMSNRAVRGIIIVGFHGRRLGEILNLKWSQIDLERKRYKLPWSKNKARKNLEFVMTDFLYNIFLEQKESAVEHNIFDPEQYVFFNPQTLTKYSDISKTWNNLKELSGIPKEDFRFHDLRHLLGTYSVEILKKPIEDVSVALGHSNITTTQIYVTRRAEIAKEVTDDMLKIFFENIEDLR